MVGTATVTAKGPRGSVESLIADATKHCGLACCRCMMRLLPCAMRVPFVAAGTDFFGAPSASRAGLAGMSLRPRVEAIMSTSGTYNDDELWHRIRVLPWPEATNVD